MDPLLPTDTGVMDREEDKDAKRKIQFSVPSGVPTQLDPRQVEMIRRRRPTPATLFRLTDPPSPEDDGGPQQWMLRENGLLKGKLVNMSSYQPPSLKAVQRIAQAHLSSIDMTSMDKEDTSSEEEVGEDNGQVQLTSTDQKEREPFGDLSSDSLTGSCDLSSHQATEDDAEDSKEEEGE
ncbi:protein phosphatase 1 regulatory subunit 1B-like isoform X2 [Synchiropus splendidus]|uniref:protein phosphatase 1 regulatory subunit 1B-like isoform X2 n=1 Tax=Synchiropus splendidus TaxID=270530 RepID=UPI00237E53CF|nr:protein phosphatase 1 regulatory subunit 1B-like isoform X2 [Synchiropus splendidus]